MPDLVLYRDLVPTYPRLVVEIAERKTETASGLIVTDLEENKPIHEAVVLAVYRPRRVHEGIMDAVHKAAFSQLANRDIQPGITQEGKAILAARSVLDGFYKTVVSDLVPGDHIFFHHSHGFATDPNEPRVAIVDERHVMGVKRV
jgi:co-chaperonin GroES (HSP10)